MKTVKEYTELRIPDYALPYLVNDDASGLDEADKRNIDAYMQQFYDEADKVKGDVIFNYDDQDGYFSSHPAFGLACNVMECEILIVTSD